MLHAYFKEPKPFLLTSAEIKYDVLTKPLLSSIVKRTYLWKFHTDSTSKSIPKYDMVFIFNL